MYGSLVLARTLTAGEIARFSSQVMVPLEIRLVDDPDNDPDIVAAVPIGAPTEMGGPPDDMAANREVTTDLGAPPPLDMGAGLGSVVDLESDETGIGYAALWGIDGDAIAILAVEVPRLALSVGLSTRRFTTLGVMASFVVLGGAFLLFIDRRVLVPTSRLTRDIVRIGREKDAGQRMSVRGRDELAVLGDNINGMLESIEGSQVALEESEARFHNLFETSRDPI